MKRRKNHFKSTQPTVFLHFTIARRTSGPNRKKSPAGEAGQVGPGDKARRGDISTEKISGEHVDFRSERSAGSEGLVASIFVHTTIFLLLLDAVGIDSLRFHLRDL